MSTTSHATTRETRQIVQNDRDTDSLTRTSRAELCIVSPDHKSIEIAYLAVEDAARILLNKVSNREILVSFLFFPPGLEPKNDHWIVDEAAIAVGRSELVITRESEQ